MPTAAVGSISLVENTARLTLADAAAFRTLVGADDQTQALDRIYRNSLPPPADRQKYRPEELAAYRAIALLYPPEEGGHVWRTVAKNVSGYGYEEGGVFVLELHKCVAVTVEEAAALDDNDTELVFKNECGQIMDDMRALFGDAPYLDARNPETDNVVSRSRIEDIPGQGWWLEFAFLIPWGIIE